MRYFIVWHLKERRRMMGESPRQWVSYADQRKAWEHFHSLKGRTRYRAISYGMGNVIIERGRA